MKKLANTLSVIIDETKACVLICVSLFAVTVIVVCELLYLRNKMK